MAGAFGASGALRALGAAAAARASGKAAPSASVSGRSSVAATPSSAATIQPKLASGRATQRPTRSGPRPATATASAAPAAATRNVIARLTLRLASVRSRFARDAPIVDPIAMPTMKVTSMPLNAYVVGPTIIARTRVHATSDARPMNPDRAMARRTGATCQVPGARCFGAGAG